MKKVIRPSINYTWVGGIARLILLFFLVFPAIAKASDTDSTKAASAKNFGVFFGFSRSNLRIHSSAYLLNDSSGYGSVSVKNKFGVAGGIFIKTKKVPLRFAAEMSLSASQLVYNNQVTNKEEHMVFPVAVEIPISYTFTLSKKKHKIPLLNVGLRGVFPLSIFDDPQPVLGNYCINGDLGIAYPLKLKNSDLSVELSYSMGLLNIMDRHTDSYQNNSVQSLYRDFILLRLYFN
ncbi:MAG: hypothetical protein IT223_09955 [Crocinitomicaceae bacterium]|nr:hypothetical protein [Crocinitomicaceae bacterium]